MKILLATYYLHDWTGSELFTVDLAHCLAVRGNEVYIHAAFIGALAQQLADEGFSVAGRLADFSAIDFDVAHVHHNVVAAAVRGMFPNLPMVMLLHGVLPELEQPPSVNLGVARYLCVSEEVLEHARGRGTFGADAEVIRNFVNAEYWRPDSPPSPRLRHVLVLSNDYPPEMRQTVEAACALVEAEAEHVGLPENQHRDVRPAIDEADLVITLGRGAIQAMAMERNVVVMGSRGGDGFIDERSFFEFRRRNFSGRTKGVRFDPKALAQELLRYDPELGQRLRDLVHAENGESEIVGRLESIYHEATHQSVAALGSIPLAQELAFLYRDSEILQERLRAKEAELAAVYESKSWRMTAPVRSLLSLLPGERHS